MILERDIVRGILAEFRRRGWWACKMHGGPMMRAGLPDILACVDGRFVALEVKRPKMRATPRQQLEMARIQKAGGAALVVTSVDEACGVAVREWGR